MPSPGGGGSRQYSSPSHPLFKPHGSGSFEHGLLRDTMRALQSSVPGTAGPGPVWGAGGGVGAGPLPGAGPLVGSAPETCGASSAADAPGEPVVGAAVVAAGGLDSGGSKA